MEGGVASIIFAMADWNGLVVQLPTVLASLAMIDPAKKLGKHLIIGVQTERDLQLCEQIHAVCWLDDKIAVPYTPVPADEEAVTGKLGWRKIQMAR